VPAATAGEPFSTVDNASNRMTTGFMTPPSSLQSTRA
jgi:hypothetical protein